MGGKSYKMKLRNIELAFGLLFILNLVICQIFIVDAWSNRSYDDLREGFMNLASDYPELMSFETIGMTVENREIILFKIGNPIGGVVLFDGAMHGWENLGSEVLFLYARWLLTSGDSMAESILESTYTLLIPALNVDSYNETRKNANGVDLNRNFATNWEYSESRPTYSEYYGGSSPLSEPESQALIGVMQKYKPNFYGNLHEGGTYYAGSTYGNRTYYSELVSKISDLSLELDVHPYYYHGEFRGSGMAISDAAVEGITSFLIELNDPAIPVTNIETEIFPRFMVIAVVISQESASIIVDSVPPVTTYFYDGLWQGGDFTIFLSAHDNQSGVKDIYYSINGGSIRTVAKDGQPLIVTEGSDNFLEYWSVDNKGNEESPRILNGIKLDKTTPIIEMISDVTAIQVEPGEEVKILVNTSDSLSGFKRATLMYNINDQATWIYLPMAFNSTVGLYEALIPPQQEGSLVRYKIEVYDNAGNKKVENNSLEYNYTVIPEFPAIINPLMCILMSVLFIALEKKIVSRQFN
jgi:hypothetical protein